MPYRGFFPTWRSRTFDELILSHSPSRTPLEGGTIALGVPHVFRGAGLLPKCEPGIAPVEVSQHESRHTLTDCRTLRVRRFDRFRFGRSAAVSRPAIL